jgi:hypothetical protein
MNRRKIVYGAIYITVAIMFPNLPIAGLKLLGGIILGGSEGLAEGTKEHASNYIKGEMHSLWGTLNPFD